MICAIICSIYGLTRCIQSLVVAACRFWKIFDHAYTFYKYLENASEILQALQKDCSMEFFRKFFDEICKKSMHFLCNVPNFASFCYQFLLNFIFQKKQMKIYFGILTKFSMQVFIFTSNEKLSRGYNLFTSRNFLYFDYQKLSCRAIFIYYVKMWLFKVF